MLDASHVFALTFPLIGVWVGVVDGYESAGFIEVVQGLHPVESPSPRPGVEPVSP